MKCDHRVVFPAFEAKADSFPEVGPDSDTYGQVSFLGGSVTDDVTPGRGRDVPPTPNQTVAPEADPKPITYPVRARLCGRAQWQQLQQRQIPAAKVGKRRERKVCAKGPVPPGSLLLCVTQTHGDSILRPIAVEAK